MSRLREIVVKYCCIKMKEFHGEDDNRGFMRLSPGSVTHLEFLDCYNKEEHRVDIFYCPFCGKRIPEFETRMEDY